MANKLKDLTGQTFGRLHVVERATDYANPWNPMLRKTRWRCYCDCGKEVIVIGECLKNGATRSCGCLKKEMARDRALNGVFQRRAGQHV